MNAWIVTYLRDRWTRDYHSERLVVLAESAELAGQYMEDTRPAAIVLNIENTRMLGYMWDPEPIRD